MHSRVEYICPQSYGWPHKSISSGAIGRSVPLESSCQTTRILFLFSPARWSHGRGCTWIWFAACSLAPYWSGLWLWFILQGALANWWVCLSLTYLQGMLFSSNAGPWPLARSRSLSRRPGKSSGSEPWVVHPPGQRCHKASNPSATTRRVLLDLLPSPKEGRGISANPGSQGTQQVLGDPAISYDDHSSTYSAGPIFLPSPVVWLADPVPSWGTGGLYWCHCRQTTVWSSFCLFCLGLSKERLSHWLVDHCTRPSVCFPHHSIWGVMSLYKERDCVMGYFERSAPWHYLGCCIIHPAPFPGSIG